MNKLNLDTNMTTNSLFRFSRDKYIMILIGFLVLVIIGLIVFGGKSNDNSSLEKEIKDLTAENEAHIKSKDSLKQKVISLEKISEEFRKKDSLKSIEIEKQNLITDGLRKKQAIAQKERIKEEKRRDEFEKNPPKHDPNNPIPLLIDTEKRINNVKNNKNNK